MNKPCPFCDGKLEPLTINKYICDNCGTEVLKAIANNRPGEDRLQTEVDRLKKEVENLSERPLYNSPPLGGFHSDD